MAKRNEGDIMEGIFSIGLADLFANNSVSRGRVNTVRAKIDTKLFQSGAFNYQYSSKEVPPDPDIVAINLQVRLKQGSTWEAYGPEWKMMYDRVGDIGNLDNKNKNILVENLIVFFLLTVFLVFKSLKTLSKVFTYGIIRKEILTTKSNLGVDIKIKIK